MLTLHYNSYYSAFLLSETEIISFIFHLSSIKRIAIIISVEIETKMVIGEGVEIHHYDDLSCMANAQKLH